MPDDDAPLQIISIDASLPDGLVGAAYSGHVHVINHNGASGVAFYGADYLPGGLAMDLRTGDIDGVPLVSTNDDPVTSTFTATNGTHSATHTHRWCIVAPAAV